MKNRIQILSALFFLFTLVGSANAQDWTIFGNNGITAANWLGTKNNANLLVKTNNTEVGLFTAQQSCAIGNGNTINGSGSFAAGTQNVINPGSDRSVALGYGNIIDGTDQFALGSNNWVTYPNAGCLGMDLLVDADHAIAIGQNITNNVPYSIMLGMNQLGLYIQEGLMGGLIGINTTTPSPFSALDVNGDIYSYGVWIGSDKRFKKEVRTLDKALDKVLALRGTEYFFTNEEFKDKNFPAGKQIGFIAQEIEQVMPDLVRSNNGTGYTVNYVGMIPVLVEAMKEQQSQIEEKDAAISCLQAQMETLEARLARLEASMGQTAPEARSFEQPKIGKAFGIAPNPTNGRFQLTLNDAAQREITTVLVFDGNGREVARRAIEAGSTVADFNLDLPNGLYNISLLTNGKLSATQTMVVAK